MNKQFIKQYGNKLIEEIQSVNFYDLQDIKDDRLTASEFTDPLKLIVLKRKLKKEIAKLPPDNSENTASLFGSAIHQLLERLDKNNPNILTEERLSMDIDGITVSGKFDRVDTKELILQDYKTTGLWSHLFDLDGEKHSVQLSIYRYLLHHQKNILVNDQALVIRMIKDYSGVLKMTNNYCKKNEVAPPDADMVAVPVQLMSLEDTGLYLTAKIGDYLLAMGNEVSTIQNSLQCTDEEMWVKRTGVRVIKEERKRCEKYCKVAPFCKQYKKWREENGITE